MMEQTKFLVIYVEKYLHRVKILQNIKRMYTNSILLENKTKNHTNIILN